MQEVQSIGVMGGEKKGPCVCLFPETPIRSLAFVQLSDIFLAATCWLPSLHITAIHNITRLAAICILPVTSESPKALT